MAFDGFSPELLRFLDELRGNNTRSWFEEQRERYRAHFLEASRSFVEDFGALAAERYPRLIADPRVNGSMFRLNRDTRFSKDKTPYKTHLALLFWDEAGERMGSPSVYFHLDGEHVLVGGGVYAFPREVLAAYREALRDTERAAELREALQEASEAGFSVHGERTKRVPRGFAADHPAGELLKHKGLYFGREFRPHPPELFDERAARWLLEAVSPLERANAWLAQVLEDANAVSEEE